MTRRSRDICSETSVYETYSHTRCKKNNSCYYLERFKGYRNVNMLGGGITLYPDACLRHPNSFAVACELKLIQLATFRAVKELAFSSVDRSDKTR